MMGIQDYLNTGSFECDVKTNINTGGLMLDQNNDLCVNPYPWSDGSNLKINTIDTIGTDRWGNYEVGIDYETIQERIDRAIKEAFKKAGIPMNDAIKKAFEETGIPMDKEEPVRVEKYKIKHK